MGNLRRHFEDNARVVRSAADRCRTPSRGSFFPIRVMIADDLEKETESAGASLTGRTASVGKTSNYTCIVCEVKA